ncbi:MAG: hypothetical protein AAB727_02860 [Patescibacteria group bacterium]
MKTQIDIVTVFMVSMVAWNIAFAIPLLFLPPPAKALALHALRGPSRRSADAEE